jgi:hypothetical protein
MGPRVQDLVVFCVAAVIGITGCQYGVTFEDCQVTCAGAEGCPSDQNCVAGMCRSNGATGACGSNSMPPGSITLSQTADEMIDSGLEIGCENTDGTTPNQSWFRLFSLSAAGLSGETLHVNKVTLGIRLSVAGSTAGSDTGIGNPTPEVNLSTYSGQLSDQTITTADVAPLKSTTVEIPASDITESVDAPIDVDANSDLLLVEIHNPDYNGTGKKLVLGATDASQTKAPYLLAPACSVNTPTTTQTSQPTAHMIITVTGTH